MHDFFFFPVLLLDKAKELLPMFCDNSQTISQRSALPYVPTRAALRLRSGFSQVQCSKGFTEGTTASKHKGRFFLRASQLLRVAARVNCCLYPLWPCPPLTCSFLRRPQTLRDASLNKRRANACPFFTGLLVGELRTF